MELSFDGPFFRYCDRMPNPTLKLREGANPSIQSKHPWVLSTSLQKSIQTIPKDSVVDLLDSNQRFVCRGLFNPDSRIALRAYTWNDTEEIDYQMFYSRIEQAIELRKRLNAGLDPKSLVARRLVFSEADRLSGLIVDAFGPYLTLQITSSGVLARLNWVISSLQSLWPCEAIVLLIDAATAEREGIEAKHEIIFGSLPDAPILIQENGLQFQVDLQHGQKTGHYLDQRQNRLIAAQCIPDGSEVLDVCTYSGGFACTIAKVNPAAHVTAIDSSQKALSLALANAAINGLTNLSVEQGDFYEALESRLEQNRLYDAIVLDPPRMASARSQVQRALAAYHRLNLLAVKLLKPGGILVTCSCSGRVNREDFRLMLLGVSKRSGREIQILDQRGAADDHPTSINCQETDYLKCFVCKIF